MTLRMKYERQRHGHTQFDFAKLVRINHAEYNWIENGRLQPNADQLARIANELMISPPSVLLKPITIVIDDDAPIAAAR